LQTYQIIIEPQDSFRWKRPFKYHLAHTPPHPRHWRGHLTLDQVAKSPSRLTLNTFSDGASTTNILLVLCGKAMAGNLFQQRDK